MTAPALARATSYGRLYSRPGVEEDRLADVSSALDAGLLMPSVTNVIDTLGKPFLASWQAREAAAAAVEVAAAYPGLIEGRPGRAKAWIAGAADRKAAAAAALGDEVHQIVEARVLGRPHEVSSEAAPFIAAWETFVADTGIEFVHVEATGFGAVADVATGRQLPYAGTADFVGRIGGRLVVGDWKTSKSIHTEAALQCAALAHCAELAVVDEAAGTWSMQRMPAVESALVVHLTRSGYRLWPAVTDGRAWEIFSRLRGVWEFHQENLASRGPLLFGEPSGAVSRPAGTSEAA